MEYPIYFSAKTTFVLRVELSHGSGTCLSQESKGSGTLSGSKAETNDDAASTSRSKSIQPNNLDLARVPKFAQSFTEFLTNACSELLNKTQHKQKTPFSDSEYLSHAESDQILATHLQHSPPNARYLSPTIQNELIDICGRQLQQDIVSECKVMMGLQI
jgi:hypothetical protein